jgi:hypothetical protein
MDRKKIGICIFCVGLVLFACQGNDQHKIIDECISFDSAWIEETAYKHAKYPYTQVPVLYLPIDTQDTQAFINNTRFSYYLYHYYQKPYYCYSDTASFIRLTVLPTFQCPVLISIEVINSEVALLKLGISDGNGGYGLPGKIYWNYQRAIPFEFWSPFLDTMQLNNYNDIKSLNKREGIEDGVSFLFEFSDKGHYHYICRNIPVYITGRSEEGLLSLALFINRLIEEAESMNGYNSSALDYIKIQIK